MSTFESMLPCSSQQQECGVCSCGGSDIRVLGCGCSLHARCTPVLPVGNNTLCPHCKVPSGGVTLFPLSFSSLDDAEKEWESMSGLPPYGMSTSSKRKVSEGGTFDRDASKNGVDSQGAWLLGDRNCEWTKEEARYAKRLVEFFDSGRLLLSDGFKLEDFLTGMLRCTRRRISKKFGNLSRPYKYNYPQGARRSFDLRDGASQSQVLSRAFETFSQSILSDSSRAEMKLVTSAQWRRHLVDFCFGRNNGSPNHLLQCADDYVQSVEELSHRLYQAQVMRGKRPKPYTSEHTIVSVTEKLGSSTMTHHQYGPNWGQLEDGESFGLEDVEPLPIHSISPQDFAPKAREVSVASPVEGEKEVDFAVNIPAEVVSVGQSMAGHQDSTADEEFLSLWGFQGPDVVGSELTSDEPPPSLPSFPRTMDAGMPVHNAKGMAHFNHAKPGENNSPNGVDAFDPCPQAIVAASPITQPSSFEVMPTVRSDHPFLSKLSRYAKSSSLPFEYFDLWVPTFNGEEGSNSNSKDGVARFGSELSCGKLRLIYAGHVTVNCGFSLADGKKWEIAKFGEYSAQFKFKSNKGMPGRVHFNCLPCWEQSVDHASPSHFARARGAARTGIRTAVGIPVASHEVGTIVVGCYSSRDLRQNDELVGRLWKDFSGWDPVPRWTLSLEDGPKEGGGSLLKREVAPQDNFAALAPPMCPGIAPPPEAVPKCETTDVSVEQEILSLLTEHIPMTAGSDPSADLLSGYMALRMLLLRPGNKRTVSEKEQLGVVVGSYRGYSKKEGNSFKWSAEEMGRVLVREYLFISQQTPQAPVVTSTTAQMSWISGPSNAMPLAHANHAATVTPSSSPTTLTTAESYNGALMHPVSPVSRCNK